MTLELWVAILSAPWQLEGPGGCGRRMLGLLAGGGSAGVAGWIDDWQLEETGGCGRRTTGRAGG